MSSGKLVPDAKKVEDHSAREQKGRMETEGPCSLQILLCIPNSTWDPGPYRGSWGELTWGYETLMGSGLKQQGREADFSVKAVPGPLASTSAFPFHCPHPHCSLQTLCKPYVVLKARQSHLEINLPWCLDSWQCFHEFSSEKQTHTPMKNCSDGFTQEINFSSTLFLTESHFRKANHLSFKSLTQR